MKMALWNCVLEFGRNLLLGKKEKRLEKVWPLSYKTEKIVNLATT
jgi:hypothetical protein